MSTLAPPTRARFIAQCVDAARASFAWSRKRPRTVDDEDDSCESQARARVPRRDAERLGRELKHIASRVACGVARGEEFDVNDFDCIRNSPSPTCDGDEFAGVSNEDVEHALIAMHAELERAQREEERAMVDALKRTDEDIENENETETEIEIDERARELALVLEAMGLRESLEGDVLCPACERVNVAENRSVLFCACGDFRIARANEGIGLKYLKEQLAATYEAHVEGGCRRMKKLTFTVRDEFGIDALYARCDECSFFRVVM